MFHKFRKNIEVSIETISLGSNVSAFAEFLIELVSINGTDDGYFTSNVLTKNIIFNVNLNIRLNLTCFEKTQCLICFEKTQI